MSRLGDLIKLERTRQGMTHKQVAKKCGVSEKFLQDVEAGTRIIADDQARRILRTIGVKAQTEADFTLEDIAATVDLQTATAGVQQRVSRAREEKTQENDAGVTGSIWLDALSGVLRRVPVYNAVMKEIAHKLVPITEGKIEGAPPDKVFYFAAPDDSMRGFRIQRGDHVLVTPASAPVDGAIMLLETREGRMLRKITRLEGFQVLVQSFEAAHESQVTPVSELHCVGRAVRLEAEL